MTQTDSYIKMINDMESGKGRLFELFHVLRDDVSLEFLNTIVNVHNDLVQQMGGDNKIDEKDKMQDDEC